MKLKSNTVKLVAFVVFLALGFSLYAQDKNEFKDKLKSIEGKVDKVTVKVDGKDVVFEGKDAEKLIEIVKPGEGKKMVWISSGDDEKVIHMGGNKMKVYAFSDDDKELSSGDKLQKKVKVEVEDGKKKVILTTIKDGKEETKTYEGEEAEKMLKEVKEAKTFNIQLDNEEGELKDNMIFMRKDADGGSSCCKCCCCGHSMGRGRKHMMIKEFDGDDDKDVQVIIKKIKEKDEKKKMMKEEKKEENKEEKKK
jgi:hypothetical protein